jgi:hypothetical protein
VVRPSQYTRNQTELEYESGQWMVTISSYIDESGKFLDSEVVVIGFLVAFNMVPGFADEWGYWLHENGLEFLEMKEALKLFRPLSKKVAAHEPLQRINALMPFLRCIRRHFHMIGGVAIDVKEYAALPEQHRKIWSDDPCYTAFTRTVLQLLEDSPSDGIISLYCDDEEKTAWPFYELYRKIKNQYPDARNKMKGITFADDRLSFPLQGSDLVSSLIRQEALFQFRQKQYDFKPLYDEIERKPDAWERILKNGVAWCGKDQLIKLGENYKAAKQDHKTVKLSDLSDAV